MRATFGLLLALVLAAPLCAREQGDFTPRGALLHARLSNAQANLKKLGGDSYLAPFERIWATAPSRDAAEMQPLIDELRAYIPSANSLEFALGDIMVREPYTQTITVVELTEGAPEEFSEPLREWVKQEFGRKAKAEPKALDMETVRVRRFPGLLVVTTGEGMLKHVEDVLGGSTEESLSKVKRFKDWRERARGDLVAFADMKAWRNCFDRLGREVDRELLDVLGILEWSKWDVFSLELDITEAGLNLRADLSLTEALGPAAALLRSAGGYALFDSLPAETLGLIAAQLGNDHERSFNELLRFFHDVEFRTRFGRLTTDIENYERWAKEMDELAARAESEEEKKSFQEQAASYREEAERMKAELASGKMRAFEPSREERARQQTRASEAERFLDEFNEFCTGCGFTREQLFEILGSEVALGIVGLPDPAPEDDDPSIFSEMWFMAARTRGDIKAIRDKFLEAMNRERGQRTPIAGKAVEGGEIITPGEGDSTVIYLGEGILGLAANDEVAKLILLAHAGKGRFALGKVPGGVPSGSKVLYADIGEMAARMLAGDRARRARWGSPPQSMQDLRSYFKDGLRLAAYDIESPTRIQLQASTGGTSSLRVLFDHLAEDFEFERAWRHDERELYALSEACDAWLSANREGLAKLKESERKDAIRAITPQALLRQSLYQPADGLRSALDPAMVDKFKAMLKARGDKLAEKSAELDESGFEWFGLPLDEVVIRSDEEYGYGDLTDAWLVAAHKGSWAREGRMCLLQSGLNMRVVWLSESDYNALKLSNSSGGRLKAFKQRVELPAWKVKSKLRRLRHNLYYTREICERKLAKDGGYVEFTFAGAEHEDAYEALRKALKVTEEDGFWMDRQAAEHMTITSSAKGYKVRISIQGEWIEMDHEGKISTSWGE
ncbi:MAG: hypothetical protein HPKKFMNG_00395 [Planctomycetes bacterium]|nr:hypothetical protein [Planctomycetota bacterium]